jgi:hypothetical protein
MPFMGSFENEGIHEVLTFSDAIAAVRREIWRHQISFLSRPRRDRIEIPAHIWRRMENALAHAA